MCRRRKRVSATDLRAPAAAAAGARAALLAEWARLSGIGRVGYTSHPVGPGRARVLIRLAPFFFYISQFQLMPKFKFQTKFSSFKL
jgi:hypothetical protein